ncbi:MAG: putative signal transducing protein [Armatimonadota bacterium]
MSFCPNCKYEYKPGFTKCPDCGAELVDELPEDALGNDSTESEWVDLVCIETYPYDGPAQAACVTLQAQGIRASLQNSVMSQADQFLVFADGGVRVMVPKEDAARAKDILEGR